MNYGSTAEGSGTFGSVNVNTGGQFGTNSASGGAPASGLSFIRLTGGDGLVATGPQLSSAPGTTNVGSLTLHGGGLLAGAGYFRRNHRA